MSNSVSPITNDPQLRLCSRCLRLCPIAEFRLRLKGEPRRQRICRACHAATERQRRAAQRAQREQATVRRFVCDVKAATTAERIGLLVALAERELGGAEQLAHAWLTHFRAASVKPGGRRVMDFFAAFMRLSVACAQLTPTPDFDAMNDAEFLEERDRLLAKYLYENLPAILESLENQGWTILPPPDCDGSPDEPSESVAAAESLV